MVVAAGRRCLGAAIAVQGRVGVEAWWAVYPGGREVIWPFQKWGSWIRKTVLLVVENVLKACAWAVVLRLMFIWTRVHVAIVGVVVWGGR